MPTFADDSKNLFPHIEFTVQILSESLVVATLFMFFFISTLYFYVILDMPELCFAYQHSQETSRHVTLHLDLF